MDTVNNNENSVIIVGGGLVGSMAACTLAKRGYQVKLYEMREDIRKMEVVRGKSINLALSERGRSAFRLLGLEDEMLNNYAIPMKGRMIHETSGRKRFIPYGREDQAIYSISRRHLNEALLNFAEKMQNIEIHFSHKLVNCNLDKGELEFKDLNTKSTKSDEASVIIGCDGAHSKVRLELMKRTRLNFSQTYIDHGYLELCIQPDPITGNHALEVNYLHIWPRGTFMMIALPNLDKTYTVTLFMPFRQFKAIKTPEKLIDFFTTYFPDSIPLIGRENLIKTFFDVGPSPLISVKCDPYHYKDRALIIGDAAHAMVPFYGQGMNCGFEDVTILNELLNESHLPQSLAKFSAIRVKDGHAICELALYNYIEMRDLVNSRLFLLRKRFDNILNFLMPNYWAPLYSMVTFSRTPYSQCIAAKQRQDKVITFTTAILSTTGLFGLIYLINKPTRLEKSIGLINSATSHILSYKPNFGKIW
ncbi:kynurenine 3-monooxygenase isoform X2 [Tetranychus urticae]|uniref:kynurenine 3-monooxygenase isoform X2 n=1 Tax=Tetranychus urticae TaxID=32264 RepID=UPI00077C09CC|nr:kynurenine 3-monooxygenase isoform X2 [Tetranychus urticae]